MNREINHIIASGQTSMGIELGSTRIKAVIINNSGAVLASGAHDWESVLENGVWTYSLDSVWAGIQDAYKKLADNVREEYGVSLRTIGSMGVSAMMHGYLPFDADGNQLTPFRTWRNTTTEKAAMKLTEELNFNIPQRWSAAHLEQAKQNGEEHVEKITFMTTLAGYVHWKLTGEKVIGIGDASGMYPIDSVTGDYIEAAPKDILPRILTAGAPAGHLTEEGARLLDPSGNLASGIPLCPPEGDAGTGMVATNSVSVGTGNVSAGTSIFAMVVLTQPPTEVHTEIDMVTTPDGKPVAMVHCNNCTGELDAWVRIFGEFSPDIPKSKIYDRLYTAALDGKTDGIISYNYLAGEPVTALSQGRPLLVRQQNSNFNLANFMRSLIYSSMATLRIGMDILGEKPDMLTGHGGLFKTPAVGQRLMAAALATPVSVMETAGEGGPWGMAVLASYMRNANGLSLSDYLNNQIFMNARSITEQPTREDCEDFNDYLKLYKKGLAVERAAVKVI